MPESEYFSRPGFLRKIRKAEKIGKGQNPGILEFLQREEIAVARDDIAGVDFLGTLENPIIGFIGKYLQAMRHSRDPGDLTQESDEIGNRLTLPSEFFQKDSRGLGQNGG